MGLYFVALSSGVATEAETYRGILAFESHGMATAFSRWRKPSVTNTVGGGLPTALPYSSGSL